MMPDGMTLNGVTAVILHYYTEFGSFGVSYTSQWLKFDQGCLHQNVVHLVLDYILLMVIFSEITEKECVKDIVR